MKQKLITALATKFTGVDAKILGRIADKILADKTKVIETDGDVDSAVEEVTFSDILTSYGDSRATDATKTAILNYEKKHGLKNGEKVVQKKDDDKSDDDDDDDPSAGNQSPMEKKMLAMISALTSKLDESDKKIAAMMQGKVTEARKVMLAEAIKDLKESQKKAYSRLPLDSYTDDDFNAFLDEVKGEVAEMVKENKAAEASSFSPLFGSHIDIKPDAKATDDEISAIINKIS